jgi:hypothetical protein
MDRRPPRGRGSDRPAVTNHRDVNGLKCVVRDFRFELAGSESSSGVDVAAEATKQKRVTVAGRR